MLLDHKPPGLNLHRQSTRYCIVLLRSGTVSLVAIVCIELGIPRVFWMLHPHRCERAKHDCYQAECVTRITHRLQRSATYQDRISVAKHLVSVIMNELHSATITACQSGQTSDELTVSHRMYGTITVSLSIDTITSRSLIRPSLPKWYMWVIRRRQLCRRRPLFNGG